jgi:formamidopyrimidine-DNA glycosylase
VLGRLGPEPLSRSFTAGVLRERLAPRRRAIKPLLLDQSFLAGLGNIYVDEALWEARIHPLRPASSLDVREARALHRAIRRVLRRGLHYRGTSLGDGEPNYSSMSRRGGFQRHLKVFRRTGRPCPRCAGILERRIVAQRSTHFCAGCQRL